MAQSRMLYWPELRLPNADFEEPCIMSPGFDLSNALPIAALGQIVDRQFSDLVLIVGTNPLSPFVVAKYFLSRAEEFSHLETVWLLYSEKKELQDSTKDHARNLQEHLEREYPIRVHLHPIRDISDAQQVQADIGELVLRIDGSHVHLNYSGGTKVMVTHTYRTLERSTIPVKSFSYLDGRLFRIINDETGLPIHSEDLRKLVRVSFQDFIGLNDFELYRPYRETLPDDLMQPLEGFKRLVQEKRLFDFWGAPGSRTGWRYLREHLGNVMHHIYNIEREKYQRKFKHNIQEQLPTYYSQIAYFHPSDTFSELLSYFGPTFPFFQPKGTLRPESDADFVNLFRMIRFLDGEWLEMYVFQAMAAAMRGLGMRNDLCMGVELKKRDWSTFFEMDVAALIGYQLIGVSCTTYDSKAPCKNKGFEVIHRTRQIGGDDIKEILKNILITYVNGTEQQRLQQELSVDTGTRKDNILVIGREDLAFDTLVGRIREFLSYTTSQETS
jgi:hypothetical protein